MNEDKHIEKLFESLQGSFDQKETAAGHEIRFLEKLNEAQGTIAFIPRERTWWKPLAMAASIALIAILSIGLFLPGQTVESQVAEIAPDMPQTKIYFANLIEEQVRGFEAHRNEDTEVVIQDALRQLERLEKDYAALEQELIDGGNKNAILSAMIQNFQNRIDILNNYMSKITMINNLKTNNDENITI